MNFFKILKILNEQLQYNINIKRFLNETISLEECQELIKKGMEDRIDNFLFCIRNLIFSQKRSPYLELFRLSHINYEDVKKMVAREGIEGTLQILKEEGIYITFEEFKGKKEIRRKGKVFRFERKDFSNHFQKGLGEVYSGGSSGLGTKISWGLGYLMQKTIHEAIMLDLHGCFNVPIALWYPVSPAQTALYPLRLKKLNIPPQIWFYQARTALPKSLLKRALSFLNSIYKRKFVFKGITLKHVSLRDAHIIAEWAAQKIKEYSALSIHTYVSSAVRICLAAKERGLNIRNTKFIVSGEPLSERKLKEIKDLGCEVVNTYYFSEGGFVGCSCNKLDCKVDEIHFFKDIFAVIQHSRSIERSGQEVNAFLFTSLYPNSPIVMLNLENGDHGMIEEKQCCCPLERYGFTGHMYNIRSHEKIAFEGATTYHINDMINVIENVLPEEFGGSSLDYQLVEEEDTYGLSQLIIYVSPRIGPLNEKKMKQILFEKLKFERDVYRDIHMKIWEQADTLKIKREYPLATLRGKTFSFIKID